MWDREFSDMIAVGVAAFGSFVLADALRFSRPTIDRWVEGKNLPHWSMRWAVVDAVLSMLDAAAQKKDQAAFQRQAPRGTWS